MMLGKRVVDCAYQPIVVNSDKSIDFGAILEVDECDKSEGKRKKIVFSVTFCSSD